MATGLEEHGGYTVNWAFPSGLDGDRDGHSSVDHDADPDPEDMDPVDTVVVHWDTVPVLVRARIVHEGFWHNLVDIDGHWD